MDRRDDQRSTRTEEAQAMTSNLSARAEAGEDAAVLLRELFARMNPAPDSEGLSVLREVARKDATTFDPTAPYAVFAKRAQTFDCLLDINTPEAHLAAAMMLVPDTMRIGSMGEDGDGDFAANLVSRAVCTHGRVGEGPTPAHALIAAIARSIDDGQ